MNALINSAVDHARTVLMLLLLLLVTGTMTYINIAKEADPDVAIPVIYTDISLEGISPQDSDRMLVRPMEKELETIEGVKELTSIAYEGGANVTLEFDAGFDADSALSDVREAVDRAKGDLPDAAEDPTVNEINTSQFPQLVIGLSGPVPERTLYNIADLLKDELESIPGVLEAAVYGKRDELVEIIIDPLVLESYNISQMDLINAVARNNELVAAGVIDSGVGRFSVKVPGIIESAQELFDLPLKSINGRVVRMRDIAEVRRVYEDSDGYARIGGQPSVTLEIIKRSGSNVIETIDEVKKRVVEKQIDWPQALEVSYFGDESTDIRNMLRDLQNNVLSAVLLVIVVVIAALGVRSAAVVAVAIPGSFVIGMLVIDMLGLTVNIVVLFSLIMAVGMLVDGAVVITEFADRRMLARVSRAEAYKQAAQRMAWPIIASTATTLAAFMPLLFWPGVMGEFMKYLPITLIATLSASLLMALIFVPTLGGLIGGKRVINENSLADMANAERGNLNKITSFTGYYVRFLAWAIRFPLSFLLLIVALLLAVVVGYSKYGKGTEFLPDVEPTQAFMTIKARGDLAVRERDDILRSVEKLVLSVPEIRTAYAYTLLDEGDDIANIVMEFKDWDKRERRVDEILNQLRTLNDSFPGLRIELQKEDSGPGGDEKPIQLAFSSPNAKLTMQMVRQAQQWMVDHGGYTDIETSLPKLGLEWNVKVDREEAGRHGVDINLIGTFVQLVTTGVKLSTYRPDDSNEELDIRVRFPPEQRHLSQLENLRISSQNGYVPLGNFATIEPNRKVSELERLDGNLVYRLMAAPAVRDGEKIVNMGQLANSRLDELHNAAEDMGIDPRVSVFFEGQDEEQNETMDFLIKAMMIALFIMAIILVSQFNSFYQAMLVLTAVALSLGGVLIGLLITGEAFGIIMTGVGVISLAGIVVNNNIVLIDTFNVMRSEGMATYEAVLRTGAQRLRPVLLTTITTVLGLLPMALKVNIDLFGQEISFGAPSTQWWSQLATAVVGGLLFSTILTLVLTPCLLAAKASSIEKAAYRMKKKSAANYSAH